MLHKPSRWSHKIHATEFLLAVSLLRLIYQQLSRSPGTDANTCPSTGSKVLLVVDHPNQACAATTAAGKFCIQQQLD